MATVKVISLVLFLCLLQTSHCKMKSLEEAIDVGTSKEFNDIYAGDGASAKKILELFHKKTKISHNYLNKVFIEAAEIESIEDLEDIHFNIDQGVDFLNKVIKHFQANPNAGRPLVSKEQSDDEDGVKDEL